MMIHGCKSSGYNWFPQSDACRECRGLPEQLSHTLQALNRGYAGGWVAGHAASTNAAAATGVVEASMHMHAVVHCVSGLSLP
jgi:hypothetical protein